MPLPVFITAANNALVKSLTLGVRAASGPQTTSEVISLAPGETLVLDKARFADLVSRADEVVRLEKKSPKDRDEFAKAMRRRDVWLSTVADEALLVWDEVDDRLDRLHADLDARLGAQLVVLHP